MLTFPCPSCGKTIGAEVPPGSAVTCPLCNKVVTVPGGASMAAPQAFPPAQAPRPMTPPPSVRQGMAVTSMVLGILSIFTGCFPILGLTGLILGIVALTKASRRPMEYGGKGFAIAGICTSLASFMFMFLVLAIMLPSLSRAREMAKRSVCAANLASTGKAFEAYANQHQGQFPPDVDTLVTTNIAQPNQFVCPSGSRRGTYNDPALTYSGGPISPRLHEAMHSCYVYIPGQSTSSDPNNVLMYEKKDCHRGEGSNVLFVDGSTRWISPYSEVEKLVTKTEARLGGSTEEISESVPAEASGFEVVLKNAGDRKIQVIKIVRAATGLGLKDAKDLVDGAPRTIKGDLNRQQAEQLADELRQSGAEVELKEP